MNGLPFLLLLAALPALGNFSGGLVAEAINVTPRMLNLALHAAAGIVIAVIAVELMPEALGRRPSGWTARSGGSAAVPARGRG